MTPCEEKGYKVGHVFEVIDNSSSFDKGSIVVLIYDDHTDRPRFELVKGNCFNSDGTGFVFLYRVKRLWPKEKDTVTITVEGRNIEISRESARALNLAK